MNVEGDFRLGEWIVKPHTNTVVGREGDARLEPRAMQVLALLAERAGDVVSKQDILDGVWEGAPVTDEVLSNAIWELRRALGDDAKSPRFIQTIPKKGYRLIAPVSPADGPAPDEASARRRWWTAALAAVVAVLVLGAVRLLRDQVGRSDGAPTSVAVADFDNQTGSEELDWLETGLPTMLRTGLAEVHGFHVVPDALERGSDWRDAAKRAGADAVVVGTVFRQGLEYRIDVQVERLADQRIVSGHRVRGEDVFAIVDELTGHVVRGLDAGPGPDDAPRFALGEMTTASLEAFRLYNEGVTASRHLRLDDAKRALSEAVRIDPGFALAYLELQHLALMGRDAASHEEYRRKAHEHRGRLPPHKRALLDAIELSDSDPERAITLLEDALVRSPDGEDAYFALSKLYRGQHRTDECVTVLERGVATIPHSGYLRLNYGYALLWEGRFSEAIHQFEVYARINPEEANPWDSLGEAYLIAGVPERALENYGRSLEIDADFAFSRVGQAWAYGQLGRYDDALAALDSIGPETPLRFHPAELAFFRAYLLSRGGRYRDAEALLARLEDGVGGTDDARLPVRLFRSLLSIERGEPRSALALLGPAPSESATRPEPKKGKASRRLETLSRLLGGIAAARSGDLPQAKLFLARLGEAHDEKDALERWWYHLLLGELALAEGNAMAAYSAFDQGEPRNKLYFNVNDPFGGLGGSLVFRDGTARAKALEGDSRAARDGYVKLLRPDIGQKWTAILEPRFFLELARLERDAGEMEKAATHYRDFLELWSKADRDLPELAEAEAYLRSS